MPQGSHYLYKSSRTRRPTGARQARGRNKQFINPSRFIKPARPTVAEIYESKHAFADFDIHPLIKENVIAKGYITPSPIQDQAIPHALEGRDVIGIANTGTGKTAAFALPLLNRLIQDRSSKALVIAPTRELAQQIEEEARSFAKGSGLSGAVLIGGSSMGAQLRDLRADPAIVIGTPGRIKDHTERGTLRLNQFNIVVLDEVDRMVDMGFINDIRFLLNGLAKERQSLFFSATVDPNIENLIRSFQSEPIMVSVKQGDTSDNVEQDVVRYRTTADKIDKLHDVLIDGKMEKALIFEETQRNVDRLSVALNARGFKVEAIHGGKTQGHRQRALQRFRDNDVTILVATDVAARGIDVADISHVINYTTPNSYDDYVHRIGRAGRAGRTGYALTFVDA
jgi:superfamily II DNA/RNA helicase